MQKRQLSEVLDRLRFLSHGLNFSTSFVSLLPQVKKFLIMFLAALIRMIIEIIADMKYFLGVLIIAIIALANGLFIAARNHGEERFTGNFIMTIIYSYRMGIGDFDTADFEGNSETLIYIFFMLTTVFIMIILLNLLIAIMGDTFDRVQETAENSMLRELT
jgi:hypothetical protein